jgi:SAM-dependent methyltransferase
MDYENQPREGATAESLGAGRTVLRRLSDWVDLQWSLLIRTLHRLAPRAHGRLLDVGCGDKPYEEIFLPYVERYVGVEHESTFSATAARLGKKRPDFVYSGERLPFENGSFDTVISIQVLEHTPHPDRLIAEMARVLKESGTLILTAPFSFRLHEQPHDYFRYSSHGLKTLCAAHGLTIEHIEPIGGLWTVIGHKVNSYLALRVARLAATAQALGKLGHESATAQSTRFWTLPAVAPAIFLVAATSRVLDGILFEPDEALGFAIVAKRTSGSDRGAAPATAQ